MPVLELRIGASVYRSRGPGAYRVYLTPSRISFYRPLERAALKLKAFGETTQEAGQKQHSFDQYTPKTTFLYAAQIKDPSQHAAVVN